MADPAELRLIDGRELEAAASEDEAAALRIGSAEPRLKQVRRWKLAAGALLGTALAAVAAATALSPGAPATVSPGADFEEKVASVKEEKKKKYPPPKPTECSLATVQNCNISQCCDNFGFQCYAKNESFGACLEKCEPAALSKKGNGTWSCKPLGLRNRCANLTENCAQFGCCADDGNQCYEKSEGVGSCKKTCDPKVYGTQGWTCAMIGIRNTDRYGGDYYSGMLEVEPSVKECSPIGESCAETKCCSWTGYKCYEKNASWASCLSQCIPGKPNGGISNRMAAQFGAPVDNPPPHWKPFFKEVGPGPWTCKRLAVPLVHGWQRGTSLYCFTVALSDNGGKKKLFELDIIKTAQKLKTSIFACNEWEVFSDVEMPLSPGKTVKVAYPHIARRPNTKAWVNTPLFINVWTSIKNKMTWKSFSWIVKADPPTVFIPSRLQALLSHQMVTPTKGVYLENCQLTRMSFHGSLEVMSKDAFGTFLDNMADCHENLPWKNADHAHYRYYGEDKFLQWCMDRHGVAKVPSRQMVETVPKTQNLYGLHLTVSCPAHRTKFERPMQKWHPNCSRSVTVSMHAFRTVAKYVECLRNTSKL